MNHKRSMSNLLTPKGKAQAVSSWRMSALVMGLAALALVTFVAPGGVAADITFLPSDARLAGTHCVEGVSGNYDPLSDCWAETMAANPELMVARRYISSAVPGTEAAFLAANPELMIARRYIGSAAPGTEAAYLAANPELMIARRYISSAVPGAEAAYLAANPELMIARR